MKGGSVGLSPMSRNMGQKGSNKRAMFMRLPMAVSAQEGCISAG